MTALTTLDDLVALLRRLGTTPSPEAPGFTELDHGLQCAYELSVRTPEDVELQVAGLVHDVGHQFGDDDAHGRLGAAAVRGLLGVRVATVVREHVPAKRYLVGVTPGYAQTLSPVSVATLAAQGGPLTEDESAAFVGGPFWAEAVTLRQADDAAKVPGRIVPGLDHWIPVMAAMAGHIRRPG